MLSQKSRVALFQEGFCELPDDVLSIILSSLPLESLRLLPFVCRAWRELSSRDLLWRGVCETPRDASWRWRPPRRPRRPYRTIYLSHLQVSFHLPALYSWQCPSALPVIPMKSAQLTVPPSALPVIPMKSAQLTNAEKQLRYRHDILYAKLTFATTSILRRDSVGPMRKLLREMGPELNINHRDGISGRTVVHLSVCWGSKRRDGGSERIWAHEKGVYGGRM
ncbi:hypothetical protein CYMTET_18341 [Cymbomonas tetramitiformis]|uniref:F-box domain-containing protein n=1 Tax=Cymbomonas tetramitiformis TaxID=36881 RepID=A0AAE0G8C0_9CHLO|nr:hypothetical protein CYMTET_18341 [Cymbomonas tetramitiformis]